MKKIAIFITCIFVLSCSFVYAYTSPGKSIGYVNDFANILSTDDINQIEDQLLRLSADTGDQLKLVTIPSLGDETIETYAVKLFEEWEMGDKELDNGVLFLIAPNERKVRIEVGYGLEDKLTDAESNNIIQNIVLPRFKEGYLPEGIIDGVNAIVEILSGNVYITSADSNGLVYPTSTSQSEFTIMQFFKFVGYIMITILIHATFWFVVIKILRHFFPQNVSGGNSSSGSYHGGSSSGSSSSRSSSSSSSSGGSSGGGGASGSW